MDVRNIYPRGFEVIEKRAFVTPFQSVGFENVEGSKEVELLYMDLYRKEKLEHPYDYVERAMALAKNFIGNDFNRWVERNMGNNPFLSNNAISFIEDTVNYLITGKRRMSLENWLLILNETANKEHEPRRHINRLPNIGGDKVSKTYVSKWLSYPGGIQDLILSLYLLFGAVPNNVEAVKIGFNTAIHKALYGQRPS